MAELIEWINLRLGEEAPDHLHPLLTIGIYVVVFLEIHPFKDGNGRLSRILITLLLLKAGYAYASWSSLESVIEQNKDAYYLALRRTQGTIRSDAPDWLPWMHFFVRALHQQMTRLRGKVERESRIADPLPDLAAQILDQARHHGKVTMGDMLRLTGASRNTLKDHFRALVEKRLMVRRGAGRGSWYEQP